MSENLYTVSTLLDDRSWEVSPGYTLDGAHERARRRSLSERVIYSGIAAEGEPPVALYEAGKQRSLDY